jgi:hypothetical protein
MRVETVEAGGLGFGLGNSVVSAFEGFVVSIILGFDVGLGFGLGNSVVAAFEGFAVSIILGFDV